MTLRCTHCLSPMPPEGGVDGYCCRGCATVAGLLKSGGLDRYYQLRRGSMPPSVLAARPRELAWVDGLLERARAEARGGLVRLTVDVQGIRCSACVWLISELFRRRADAVEVLVDPSVGRAALVFRPELDVKAFLRELESFGYGTGPERKEQSGPSDRLLARLGVCVALSMNAMMFSAANYLGMGPRDGTVYHLMRALNFALGVGVLALGGSLFISQAWRGLRLGLLSLDLPIALGITLGFAGSTAVMLLDESTFSYFDSLNAFTTLMLVGRWLQRRVLEQNQRRLLADDGVDGLYAQRLEGTRVVTVPAAHVQAHDVLLVPPGDLLVCPGTLLDDAGSFSLDWVNGESEPRDYTVGATVPAGAFNAHQRPARLEVTAPFASSSLRTLLMKSSTEQGAADELAWLRGVTAAYVPATLLLAAAGFLSWWSHGVVAAVQVATALLVVTCPCALGLALPMAAQLTAAGLKRQGLFVCRPGFLERAAQVKRILFDKTGTLTLGTLRLRDDAPLRALEPGLLEVLSTLVAGSSHPKSRCVLAAIPAPAQRFRPDVDVREQPGQGLEAAAPGLGTVRLGTPSWALGKPVEGLDGVDRQVWLSVDGVVVARLETEEELRPDVPAQVQALRARGYAVGILSGDSQARVDRVADRLGIPHADAVGELLPEGKAAWMAAHACAVDTLLLGDGINDRPAFDQALCTGTPAVDRPTLAARADFYFLTPGIACIGAALDAAARQHKVTRRILAMALTYNVLSITACFLGWMGPVLAAVAMPSSSLAVLLYAIRASSVATASARAAPAPSPQTRVVPA